VPELRARTLKEKRMKTYMFLAVAVLAGVAGLWAWHELGYRPWLLALATIAAGCTCCGLSEMVRQIEGKKPPKPPSQRYLPRAGEDFPKK
jgi:hypothetical protein